MWDGGSYRHPRPRRGGRPRVYRDLGKGTRTSWSRRPGLRKGRPLVRRPLCPHMRRHRPRLLEGRPLVRRRHVIRTRKVMRARVRRVRRRNGRQSRRSEGERLRGMMRRICRRTIGKRGERRRMLKRHGTRNVRSLWLNVGGGLGRGSESGGGEGMREVIGRLSARNRPRRVRDRRRVRRRGGRERRAVLGASKERIVHFRERRVV